MTGFYSSKTCGTVRRVLLPLLQRETRRRCSDTGLPGFTGALFSCIFRINYGLAEIFLKFGIMRFGANGMQPTVWRKKMFWGHMEKDLKRSIPRRAGRVGMTASRPVSPILVSWQECAGCFVDWW